MPLCGVSRLESLKRGLGRCVGLGQRVKGGLKSGYFCMLSASVLGRLLGFGNKLVIDTFSFGL
jgi:hypothetical protein